MSEDSQQNVIEIGSSDDESSKRRLKTKRRKIQRNSLIRNKPLTFEEFGFKFMEDENENSFSSNSRDGKHRVKSKFKVPDTGGSGSQIKSTFTCEICNKEVVSRYNLRRHMMIHTNEKPFTCDICNKKFREFSDMRKHKNVHVTGNRIFECNRCGRSFTTYKAEKCYFCDDDNDCHTNSIKTEISIEPETIIQESDAASIRVTSRKYSESSDSDDSWMDSEDEIEIPKIYKCTICPKSFRSNLFRDQHIAQHLTNST